MTNCPPNCVNCLAEETSEWMEDREKERFETDRPEYDENGMPNE